MGHNCGTWVSSGSLTLGDANGGLNLVVGDRLNVVDGADLGQLTSISGGTISASNGVSLGVGAVSAKVAAAFGSSIVAASGNLTLGDSASPAGFAGDGELIVNNNTVTLHDANDAVLGSLTTIGTAGADGTLVADNGLTIAFGKNVTGRGLIATVNDPLKPVINNGHIAGDSGEPTALVLLAGCTALLCRRHRDRERGTRLRTDMEFTYHCVLPRRICCTARGRGAGSGRSGGGRRGPRAAGP